MTTTDTRLAIDLSLVVAAKKPVAEDVVALYLTAPDGSDLPAWSPGAHVDLVLDDGVMRQYSLCGDIRDVAMWRIAVLREAVGRGGSKHVHDALAAGTPVQVRGPRNRFGLVEADRYLFIAGGIGITPILPMIAAVEAAGREWRLLYGGRQRTSMAFLEELSRNGSRVSIQPQDESGLLDLDSVLDAPEPDTAVYCCGPEALLAPWRNAARAGQRTRCMSSASRRHRKRRLDRSSRSRSSCNKASGRCRFHPTRQSCTPSKQPESTSPPPAKRAPAEPARPTCSRAHPTTATTSSARPSENGVTA